MRKIILSSGLLLATAFASAQNGLDSIIVEKYYVSNLADSLGSIGTLPTGSVTYRIFVDMQPSYSLQAVFGQLAADNVTPLHPLKVNTSTTFFNNEDRGDTSPNSISSTKLNTNTVAIDSWFAFSGTSNNQVGVLKSDDDGLANLIHTGRSGVNSGVLTNTVSAMGIPLTVQDGMIPGTPGSVGFIGTNSQETTIFGATSQAGNSFLVDDGSFYFQGSIAGPDPTGTNRILIGQFTTDGIFSFELNLQLAIPGGGTVKYMAKSPDPLATSPYEFTIPSLAYTTPVPNVLPTVNITAPANAATYSIVGSTVNITANATDSDGTVDSVVFFVDGTKIGKDISSPYTNNWTSTAGTHTLTAIATDNSGGHTTSSNVIITVGVVNSPPSVSIISPANAATYTVGNVVNITANATDSDGTIDSVVFFVDGTKIGKDISSPYTNNWTNTVGTHTLTAIATDNSGGHTTSSNVVITVSAVNLPPSVSITTPANAATYTVGNIVNITANATDSDGTIDSVVFLIDGVRIGNDVSSPYAGNWTSTVGTHTLTVIATDNNGAHTTSSSITITIVSLSITGITITNTPDQLFTLYPNPADDIINIEVNSNSIHNVEYLIYDLIGNVILSKKTEVINGIYKETIDVSYFPKGLYIIKMISDNIISTKKVIIN